MTLVRVVECFQGSVLVDGEDIRDFPLAFLRSGVTVISQDAHLFSGNVREAIDPLGQVGWWWNRECAYCLLSFGCWCTSRSREIAGAFVRVFLIATMLESSQKLKKGTSRHKRRVSLRQPFCLSEGVRIEGFDTALSSLRPVDCSGDAGR